MSEINLPIKYTLFALKDNSIKAKDTTFAYIIGKCYVLEENIKYDINGSVYANYTIIPCENAKYAFSNNEINDKYIDYVKYIYSDYEKAKEKRVELNEKLFKKLSKTQDEQVINNLKIKTEKMVNSMQKIRKVKEKNFQVTDEKKLVLK